MEEEDEESPSLSQASSTATLTQHNIHRLSRTSIATLSSNPRLNEPPQFQVVTQQASGDLQEDSESESLSLKASPRYSLLSKSPHSSSSQEEYEPEHKHTKGQFLSAAGHVSETAKSMESLRASPRSFLTSSERDMRKIFAETTEAKSLESIEREIKLKRRAVSGEGSSIVTSSDDLISAERRRVLWSGKMRIPQHLSLPPPAGYLSLSPGDRKLTILSPHSPHKVPEMLHYSSVTLKSRRKKATILPRLVLPRSDSEISEVFSEHGLE